MSKKFDITLQNPPRPAPLVEPPAGPRAVASDVVLLDGVGFAVTGEDVPAPASPRFHVHHGPGYEIAVADWIVAARALPDACVNAVVTSVPYWGLRDYGVAGQLGIEASFFDWLRALVEGFREIRRILHPSGTLWVNCGDAYAQGGRVPAGFKHKDRMMMPARLAIALQEDGWYLRSEIVWGKVNPMPESIKDRPTSAHEMVYLFSKERTYFYDNEAVREPYQAASIARRESALSALAAGRPNDSNVGDRTGANRPNRGEGQMPKGTHPRGSDIRERALVSSLALDPSIAPGRSDRDRADFAAFRVGPREAYSNGGTPPPKNDGTAYAPNPSGRNRRDVWNQADELPAYLEALAQALDDGDLLEIAAAALADARCELGSVISVPTARFAGNHTATYPPDLVEPILKAATSQRGVCPACRAPWARVVVKGELDLDWQKASGGDANGEYHGRTKKAEFIAATDGAVRSGGRPGGTGATDPSALKARVLAGMRKRRTTGWRPTCGCSADERAALSWAKGGKIDPPMLVDDALRVAMRFQGTTVGMIGDVEAMLSRFACADPSCGHPHADNDACSAYGAVTKACRCRCFRWGAPFDPVPAVVYDPFSGMATTSLVAARLGRHSMGSEISPVYAADSVKRLQAAALERQFGAVARNGTESEKAACAAQRSLFE